MDAPSVASSENNRACQTVLEGNIAPQAGTSSVRFQGYRRLWI